MKSLLQFLAMIALGVGLGELIKLRTDGYFLTHHEAHEKMDLRPYILYGFIALMTVGAPVAYFWGQWRDSKRPRVVPMPSADFVVTRDGRTVRAGRQSGKEGNAK